MVLPERVSTGYVELDHILDGLRIGDNVVLKVESIENYRYFIGPFVDQALRDGRQINYMRFGDHLPLLGESPQIKIHQLDPRLGFESFARSVYNIATEQGSGAFYVFDCLSDLLSAWATDHMVGNFFRVTCPYLFELDTVAYFALIRDHHSFKTVEQIRDTTQVLIDVFNHEDHFHIQPLKVWQRRSPTMFLPHHKKGDKFIPLSNSFESTRLFNSLAARTRDSSRRQIDHWHRLFIEAEELCQEISTEIERADMVRHICRHMIAREERMLTLTRQYFSLHELLEIKSRVIGTGFIGGKAVGMLLAHNILRQDESFNWDDYLEHHDSHYVGSNVYYSYIVHNGLWRLFMRQKTEDDYFSAATELREKMLAGSFPDKIREGFQQLLEYYGQYPIIIRSSSLLEDGFGNAFAGKYDSFFCVNQGSPEERLQQLETAVRKIFASAMSEDALTYRLQRGLSHQDEQMALLVQRVSGAYRDHYYLPELSGVGVSYNTFVWDKEMDPQSGMLRLVVGLGTHAVDRAEVDYPRVIALDSPKKRQHKGFEDVRKFSQHDVDLLNVNTNSLETVSLLKLTQEDINIPWSLYAVKDYETMQLLTQRQQKKQDVWRLTFDDFLEKTSFTTIMKRLLKTIEAAYEYPVDVEFTVNFTTDRIIKIDVVQCRPLQTKGSKTHLEIPENVPAEKVLFRSSGNFMGGNISQDIEWIIWVEPSEYLQLPLVEKYEIARVIGALNKLIANQENSQTMLLGPGRWGTTTPSLGVPISFSEISNLSVLVEVAFASGDLMPELSFGSHFFQDLVEADIFYLALFPENKNCFLNQAWFKDSHNSLAELLPSSSRYKEVVKVYNASKAGVRLMADVISQRLICCIE
ncbi:PEP/pyruvate-binding domain-containing protein [uncultured Desulfuromusa sp.]|uniref:PEP/pyruvate-binding domain-containing protein n=1 Tax=uncultured Desulfuromusa sp. TaxID=219183 RepID=UPI002AA804A2|nr:PEP/pyruvate-binding domain-containing protein [uncultured Desulfuromusa sp.]